MPDTFKIRVLVRPKSGILDPQGEAVRRALPALGFEGVKTVHIGRLVEMEVDSADEVEGMCKRLLANPTIEEYEWEVVR
jgi:phosphoribosylformylglycinamidine synthase